VLSTRLTTWLLALMTDHVYEDTRRSYDFSQRLAGNDRRGWETLAARIDTRGEGVPIVVFNPLGWPRTDMPKSMSLGERGVLDMSWPILPESRLGCRFSGGSRPRRRSHAGAGFVRCP